MKYLITGYKGQLGYDVKRELLKRGVSEENILPLDKDEMDITNREEVNKVVKEFAPNVIFHCAAWTAVDKAEDMEDACYNVNVVGTKNVVDASIEVGATTIYMSTDYVFDGTKEGLYTEEDKVNPKSVYGRTKFLGEEEVRRNPKHFITRISWVFGINGHNFIRTMLKLSDNHSELNVVDDQIGCPTWTVDLADGILSLLDNSNEYGIYHICGSESTSWFGFAKEIFRLAKLNVNLVPCTTNEFPRPAKRPKYSVMDNAGIMRNWKKALKEYIELRVE